MKEFKTIKNFIFDCDGVLYADLEKVFGQVSKRMTGYISKKLNLDLKKAKELQTMASQTPTTLEKKQWLASETL